MSRGSWATRSASWCPPPGGRQWDRRTRRVALRRGGRHRPAGRGRPQPPADHQDRRRASRTRAGRATRRPSPSCATGTCSSCPSRPAARRAGDRRPAAQARDARDRQPEVPQGRGAEADRVHARGDREAQGRPRRSARRTRRRSSRSEEGQTVVDPALSPDGEHVFLLVNERPAWREDRRHPELRHRVGLQRDDPGARERRRRAGPPPPRGPQPRDRARPCGPMRPSPASGRRCSPGAGAATGRTWTARCAGACRCSRPTARWPSRGCGPPTSRTAGSSPSIAESGKARVIDLAARRRVGVGRRVRPSGQRRVPAPTTRGIYFTSEKDGWMHLHVVDASQPGAKATRADARASGRCRPRHALRATGRGSTSPRASGTPANATSTPCRSTAASGRRSRR